MSSRGKKSRQSRGKLPAPKKPLFQTTDVWGNTVHCTQDNWTTHIIVEHPELLGREADVKKAIEDPDRVSPSTKTGQAFGLEKDIAAQTIRAITYYDDPIVREAGATKGQLGTAYVVDTVNYASRVGAPIYVKPQPTPTVEVIHQTEQKEEKDGK